MDFEYYDKYINKNTIGRYDVTPIFENYEVFSNLLNDLIKPFKDRDIEFNKIVGLDALGFIIGGALAQKEKVGFVPIRKGGKLPGVKDSIIADSFIDYSNDSKSFEINKSSIKEGDKIIIVDEWIETGTQVKSAIKLIEKLKGEIVGITTLNADKNKNIEELNKKYLIFSIN
ncbi:adenine phosphoribosyltransferase [Candidatus Woesearchaeota archaeon]|nr:MAG: adenine phosphoribosyltransferase [Candidatus Woesearchaeota archaeon]